MKSLVKLFKRLGPVCWFVTSLGLGLPLASLGAYELSLANRIYPGVRVNEIQLGGQTPAQAALTLNQILNASASATLRFTHQDQAIVVPLARLNFRYNASSSALKAFKIGRQGSFWQNLKTKLSLLAEPVNLNPDYDLDPQEEEKVYLELHALVDQPPVFPQLSIENNQVAISQGRPGQVLDDRTLKLSLTNRFRRRAFTETIVLPVETVDPVINQARAKKAQRLLTILLSQPLTLIAADLSFSLEAQDILDFIQPIEAKSGIPLETPASDIFAPVPEFSTSPSLGLVSLEKINRYLETEISPQIYRPSQDAAFRVEGGKVTVFQPSQDGRRLNLDQTTPLLAEHLEKISDRPELASFSIEPLQLPIVTTPAKIPTSAVNNLGIESLLGRGVSYFRGSIANRIDNIALAASHFNGVLVEPGAEASFNELIGEVSKETGFKEAYVIKQGRTVLDDGGGVCQVSTTLFRAIMAAGLPITERLAHAYRVAYYEQGFDPGLDATVYAPSVDLKFINDTPAYLLIQTQINRQTATLTFEIYGTDDGRRSIISKPMVTNVQPPPEPLYQDDPTLPKGKTKQVDWAAWGATVTYTYTVSRGGETIFNKTYVSKYRPWQAVYLVGTKEN